MNDQNIPLLKSLIREVLAEQQTLNGRQRGKWFEYRRDTSQGCFVVACIRNKGILKFKDEEAARECVVMLESLVSDVVAESTGTEVIDRGRKS